MAGGGGGGGGGTTKEEEDDDEVEEGRNRCVNLRNRSTLVGPELRDLHDHDVDGALALLLLLLLLPPPLAVLPLLSLVNGVILLLSSPDIKLLK